jgi:hypothetical protein
MAYKVKHVKFDIRRGICFPNRGWCILVDEPRQNDISMFVWKDLEIHNGTGFNLAEHDGTRPGQAPGYYSSKLQAEVNLETFKEKHSMKEDKLTINVKLNGVDTPLHEISEETLLRIREASKPKPVPVFQVCDYTKNNQRLVFRVTQHMIDVMNRNLDKYIFIDRNGRIYGSHPTSKNRIYSNYRELRLDEV